MDSTNDAPRPVTADPRDREITILRARVEQLERELFEQQRRTNLLAAEAQTQLYWLERWHVDVNELMDNPRADTARAVLRRGRAVFRWLKHLKRRPVG